MTDAERIAKLEQVVKDMQKLIGLKDKVINNYKLIVKATVQSYDAGKFKREVLPTLRIISK